MTNRLKKRWFAVGLVWALLIAGSAWNMVRISEIQHRRQALEILKMDLRYLKIHSVDVDRVAAQEARLTQHVTSFGLGFLVVENNLKQISEMCGLAKVKIKTENQPQEGQPAPIHVSGTGAVPALMRWLATVEETYPYLTVSRLEINNGKQLKPALLKVTFTYRYSLALLEKGNRI